MSPKSIVPIFLVALFAAACGSVNSGDGDGDGDGDVELTVELAGGGAGSVVSDPPGIDCPDSCTAGFAAGTQVTLTASAALASGFDGWSSECSGLGPCVVSVDSDLTITATFEQGGTVKDATQLGGNGADFAFRAITAANGDVLIAGTFTGTLNLGGDDLVSLNDPNGVPGVDVYIARFDPDLNHVWSVRYGSAGTDEINGLVIDGNGDVGVAGGFGGVNMVFGTTTLVHAATTNFNAYVAKLAGGSGAAVWAIGNTGTSIVRTHGIAFNGEDDVIATFFYKGTADFGKGNIASAGGDDMVIAKYSGANGAHVWSNDFGGVVAPGAPADDQIVGVGIDGDDNILVQGFFFGTINLGGANDLVQAGDNRDEFIARYTTDGNHDWSRPHSSNSGIFPASATVVDSNGDLVIGGRFAGTSNFGGDDFTSVDDLDIYLAKYSGTNGSHVWSKHYPGAGFKTPRGGALLSNNDVVFGGFFGLDVDFDGTVIPNAMRNNMFALRVEADTGDLVWVTSFGDQQGAGGGVGRAIAASADDRVYLVGTFNELVNFGPGNDFLSTSTAEDVAVVKLIP